jgi:uncharacterized integral membrane protein
MRREQGDRDPSDAVPDGADATPDRAADYRYRREAPSGKLIALGIVIVLIAIFVLQNRDRADVDLFFWDARLRIWTVILIAVALGFIAGWLVGRVDRRKRDARDRRD